MAPKVGTQVVSRASDGRMALGRLGSLIEQLEVLIKSGREVILISYHGRMTYGTRNTIRNR